MAQMTTDQLDLLRDAHYEGSAYLIAGPQDIIFAARVNGTPTGSDFAQITYDTVTTGAYTDLIVDHDVRISHTNDVRKAFFYGRVRKTPTSTILYINETSAAIVDNDYVFVVDSFPLVKRQRYKTFVDWDRPYNPLPPIESNVDSAYAVLTREATAEFSLVSIGQALEDGSTIAGVLWEIPDATYTVGDDESEEITIEVDTPYNHWGHLTLTDSNGTTNTLHFTISAGDPNTAPFFRLCHEDVPVSSDWNNGFSATATYWAGIEDLLDNTRITLVSDETFDGEALGVLSPVQFVGYLNASVSSTAGDEEYAQRKDAQLTFTGLMQLAGKVRFNQIAIRHSASPTAWDQIDTPTPPRNITHELVHHSTFLNLCSLDFDGIDEDYLTGNTNVEERSMTDAARKVAREINGYLVQDATGKVKLVRDPSVGSTTYRASIPDKTPTPIHLGDVYKYTLPVESSERVGWLDAGFMVINPTTLTPTFITANAPYAGPGDGPEDATESSQLLMATANLNDALAEARQRGGDLYARANNAVEIEVDFGSGWGGVVRATPGEYYQFSVDSTDDTRGNGIDPEDNWLCLSVNMTINRSGTQNTTGRFIKVTQGGDALINVAISPSVINTPIPVLPVISPYPAFPMAPSINYDTVDPTNKIPHDPFSGMQTLPMTTEEAAEAAQNQPDPGESRAYTHFNYDGDVEMNFITVLGAPYTLRVEGSGKIRGTYPGCADLTAAQGTWTPVSGAGEYDPGGGLAPKFINQPPVPPNYFFGWNKPAEAYSVTIVKIRAVFNESVNGVVIKSGSGTPDFTQTVASDTIELTSANAPGVMPFISNVHGIEVGFSPTYVSPSSTLRLISFCMYTATGEMELYADAFYEFNKDDEGNPINVALRTGLKIDNNAIAVVPPFNRNHIYEGLDLGDFNGGVGGTGNRISFRFADTTYSDNDRLPFWLSAVGEDAGT